MKGKSLLEEKCVERDGIRAENAQMKNKYEKSQIKLSEFQSTFLDLEARDSEISARITGLNYLKEQIKVHSIHTPQTLNMHLDANNRFWTPESLLKAKQLKRLGLIGKRMARL